MLQQPVRLGGLALACALATSTLVLVTLLASNLVLSAIGGLGLGNAARTDPGTAPEPPASAVLVSSGRDDASQPRGCRQRGTDRDAGPRDRCAGQRDGGERVRP